MRDIWNELVEWDANQEPFAVARVVETWGSSPRKVGSAMLVDGTMKVAGSVSGGCIEGAVIEEAQQVLVTGNPKKLSYGVDDQTAWSAGLSCGGEVSVLVERHWPLAEGDTSEGVWQKLRKEVGDNRPVILLTRVNPDGAQPHLLVTPDCDVTGLWGELTEKAVAAALDAYEHRASGLVEIEDEAVFVQVFPQCDQLIVIGAGHISLPLVQYASLLDFETVVIDPREVFAKSERFPVNPTRMFAKWPEAILDDWDLNEATYCVVLTHDPKIDDQALHFFLEAPVAYIGALGGRKSHAKRRSRLKESGYSDAVIDRIKGPVGLDIGAETPAEIALSIVAEIVARKRTINNEF
tara:strand:+ start:557 stop:1609 length:1053 start_codon:yes stop_codon:yes gene_type:complete